MIEIFHLITEIKKVFIRITSEKITKLYVESSLGLQCFRLATNQTYKVVIEHYKNDLLTLLKTGRY